MLAEKRDHIAIRVPDNIFDGWRSNLREGFLLLNIEENDRCARRKEQARGAAIEDIISLYRAFNALCNAVAQVTNFDRLCGFVENSESVASDE